MTFREVRKAEGLENKDQGWILDAIFIWGANTLPGIFGAAFWWIASRLYIPAHIGLASGVISANALLALFSRLGFDISLIRFLPETEDKNHLVNTVFSIVLGIIVVLTSGFLIFLPILSPKLIDLTENPIYILGFFSLSILNALLGVLRAVFVGSQSAKYSLFVSLISNSLSLGFIFFGQTIGASGIVGSVLVGLFFSVAIGIQFYLTAVISGYKFRISFDCELIYRLFPYSFGNFLVDFVMQAPQTILPLLILNILGEISNAHAYIALMTGSMLAGPGLALARSVFAKGASDLEDSNRILKKAAIVGTLFTLAIAGLGMLIAPWILGFFGQSYKDKATILLRWISASSPLIVLVQLFFTKLRLNKNLSLMIGLSFFNVITILLVTSFGLKEFGISAAGIGVVSGNLIALVIIVITLVIKRKRGNSLG